MENLVPMISWDVPLSLLDFGDLWSRSWGVITMEFRLPIFTVLGFYLSLVFVLLVVL